MQRGRVFQIGFSRPRSELPAEPEIAPEPDGHIDDADQPSEGLDPFAEDDALAAMDHADFYWQLRGEVDRVAAGELPGGTLDAHPAPKDRPRSKRYKRRDKHGRAF